MNRELDTLVHHLHAAGVTYSDAVREFKKSYILAVLMRHRGNQCKAAEVLGMHRNTLSRTLAELGLDSAEIRQGSRHIAQPERRGVRIPPRSVRLPETAARPAAKLVSSAR